MREQYKRRTPRRSNGALHHDDESPVLRAEPSSMGHVESCVNSENHLAMLNPLGLTDSKVIL